MRKGSKDIKTVIERMRAAGYELSVQERYINSANGQRELYLRLLHITHVNGEVMTSKQEAFVAAYKNEIIRYLVSAGGGKSAGPS